jgi:biotin-dependent carboxylase-like uncharacterized protein
MIEIVQPGLLTTVQDLGRPGYAHLGVARSGALDPLALRLANRLVGNEEGAAALETTLTGCALRTDAAATVAVTGAPAEIAVDGRASRFAAPVHLPAGAELRVGKARSGVRSYVAIGGGLTVATVLGSRATDTLSGLGTPPLRRGDTLPVGSATPTSSALVQTVSAGPWTMITLRIRYGPRDDWFTSAARTTLVQATYTLTAKSNRVGARLSGAALDRSNPAELPSEGIVLGAVQVPADGQPLVFLADHPTTGGYPVIAVVEWADLAQLAQARPGASVRFQVA